MATRHDVYRSRITLCTAEALRSEVRLSWLPLSQRPLNCKGFREDVALGMSPCSCRLPLWQTSDATEVGLALLMISLRLCFLEQPCQQQPHWPTLPKSASSIHPAVHMTRLAVLGMDGVMAMSIHLRGIRVPHQIASMHAVLPNLNLGPTFAKAATFWTPGRRQRRRRRRCRRVVGLPCAKGRRGEQDFNSP